MSSLPIRPVRRRRRAALSCLECRRRKIKCDRNDPCQHCVATGSHCTFKTFPDSPMPGHHLPLELSSPVVGEARTGTQLDASTQELRDTGNDTRSCPAAYVSNISVPPTQTSTSSVLSPHPNPENQGYVVRAFKQQSFGDNSLICPIQQDNPMQRDPTKSSTCASQPEFKAHQVPMKKTRVEGWAQWIYPAPELELIGAFKEKLSTNGTLESSLFSSPQLRGLLAQSNDLMGRCKVLARKMKVQRPSRNISISKFDLALPAREVSDAMVSAYFTCFESAHRILHIPSFWAEYEQELSNHLQDGSSNGRRLKALLVVALGSSVSEKAFDDLEYRNKVHHWIFAAQAWLAGPMEKDRLNITGIQVHCLTILARMAFSIGGDLVWLTMGSLVHKAMQIGLHIDPSHLSISTQLQAEVRRRLWATILDLITQSSLDSSMPPRMSFDDFNTEPPANVNDEDLRDEPSHGAQLQPRSVFTSVSMQLLLYDSLKTRLQVVQLVNGLRSEPSYEEVLSLSSQIVGACRACNAFAQNHRNITPFHRNLLDHLVRRFQIPLHCPFYLPARTNPLFTYSRNMCFDTALALISPEPDESFPRLLKLGSGLFREGFRYAISIITLEYLSQTKTQQLDGTLLRDQTQRRMLKSTLERMVDMSAERIRLGETNIKAHWYLKMIVSQVEAIEAGTSQELNVATSSLESVEFCHGLLEERVARNPLGSLETDQSGRDGCGSMDFDLDFFLQDPGSWEQFVV